MPKKKSKKTNSEKRKEKRKEKALPIASPYLVPFDGRWKIAKAPQQPPEDAPQGKKGKKANKKVLEAIVAEIYELQRVLYAYDRYSLLLIFQAMDAAGKDGTIRAVMTGINPAGCQVRSFSRPSHEELDHDFLWRCGMRLPERGRIGIFNRSHYEEVLVVRVHPEILGSQRLPEIQDDVWERRYASIRNFEKHAADNGTVVLKFFLNVSKEEQKERLLERIDDERKNWKFEAGDLDVRDRWDEYMKVYQSALNATSRPWAPWYAIPADDKPYMRATVAGIVRDTLATLPMRYPRLDEEQTARLAQHRKRLEAS